MVEMVKPDTPVKNDGTPRKNKKPLMERRRRARINDCLDQLKSLLMHTPVTETRQQSSDKMEKAHILELAVKHLRGLQLEQDQCQDVQVVSKYRAGFRECASEVARYLGSLHTLQDEVKARMQDHLSYCVRAVETSAPFSVALQRTLNPAPLFTLQQEQRVASLRPLDGGRFPPSSSVVGASALDGSGPPRVTLLLPQPVATFPPQPFAALTARPSPSAVVPSVPSAFTVRMPAAGGGEMAALMAGVPPTALMAGVPSHSYPVRAGASLCPCGQSQSCCGADLCSAAALPRSSLCALSDRTVTSSPLDLAPRTSPDPGSVNSGHTSSDSGASFSSPLDLAKKTSPSCGAVKSDRRTSDSGVSSSSPVECNGGHSPLADDKPWRPW